MQLIAEATREKATSIAKLAVDLAPNDVDSWGTYAQLLSGHAYHDTSLFAICDDAFARYDFIYLAVSKIDSETRLEHIRIWATTMMLIPCTIGVSSF
jgi:hypothetical protein